MDNMVKTFVNEEFGSVRTIEENGRVMFCGKDVALALGYSDTNNAIKTHCKKIRKHFRTSVYYNS